MEVQDDSPNRKIYTITQKGLDVLKALLEKPVENERLKYEVLVKIFFWAKIPVAKSIEQIQEFNKRNQFKIDSMNGYEKELKEQMDKNEDHLFYYLTVLLGKKVYQALKEWAEEAIELLMKKDAIKK